MKYSIFLTLAATVVTVNALCDGTPDPTWRHYESCSPDNGLLPCNERCQSAGFVCGGCGGFAYDDCWCCNDDCV